MTNLSTSSSKIHRWFLMDVAIALCALGLLELGLHLSSSIWLSGKKYGDFRADVIEAGIKKSERLKSVDVAVVGSSVSNAIDPDLLASYLGNEVGVEDFVLYSADSNGTLRNIEEIILPNIDVSWLVYVVSPRDVNALSNVAQLNESIPDIDAYSDNPTTYKAKRLIEKNFFIYRYRNTILNTVSVSRFFSAKQNTQATPGSKADFAGVKFVDFELAERFLSDLEKINELCKISGARLAVVTLPTNPSEDITRENFQKAALGWTKEMESFLKDHDIAFLNTFNFITEPAQFKDSHHLSQAGELAVTRQVSRVLKVHGFP